MKLSLTVACLCTLAYGLRTAEEQHAWEWTGEECDAGCEHKGGEVCGWHFKHCCKIRCVEGRIYDSCKDDEEYKKSEIDCTIEKEEDLVDMAKKKIFSLFFG